VRCWEAWARGVIERTVLKPTRRGKDLVREASKRELDKELWRQEVFATAVAKTSCGKDRAGQVRRAG
jgi:hypothetical protein